MVEPFLSALFMMRVSSLVSFLGACHCLHVRLSLDLGYDCCALSVVFCNLCDFDANVVVFGSGD